MLLKSRFQRVEGYGETPGTGVPVRREIVSAGRRKAPEARGRSSGCGPVGKQAIGFPFDY